MVDPTKILVVDDEPDLESLVRMKFRRQVREGALDFTFAQDGLEALEKLQADPAIDIVLTDINMPRMDGLTLLARLDDLNRMLKAIVVSAYGDLKNIRTAMNRGSFDFLIKPVDLEDLEITVNKARDTIEQQKMAQLVRDAFGRYMSSQVAASLLAEPAALKLGGDKRKVTMLMSDVRGFSMISENLPPERVVEILNIYLGRMADIITDYHGTIDEFIGDAIFVLFGAPIQRDDDATRAVACALDMQLAMADVNADLAEMGMPALEMGIGINTGEVVVGNIGSVKRAKYGAVGSHVNLTSRIETYTTGGQILISEHTLQEVQPHVQISLEMEVSTKGFTEPIRIYEVEGIRGGYDLWLSRSEEHLEPLPEPEPFRYEVLDGKHLTGDVADGAFVALSSTGALVRLDHPVEPLDNLKVMVLSGDDPGEVLGDLYAKVIQVDRQGDLTRIRFTAVPEDLAQVLQHLNDA